MNTIYLHAGMAKAGSTSIQAWISEHSNKLISELGIQPVVARPGVDSPDRSTVDVVPYQRGSINSTHVLDTSPEARSSRIRELMKELDAWANETSILLTTEALARPFWAGDVAFLTSLNNLARSHPVEVAYYVRPQHTALEAGWRQWGFRSGAQPSRYMSSRSRQLHYHATVTTVQDLAPDVRFIVRPFRRDLLEGRDVVDDFAKSVLGYAAGATGAPIENPGLPLALVNLLRAGPSGWFWDSPHDNRRLDIIRRLCAGIDWADDPVTSESREILRAYTYRTFEPGNQRLIAALGWNTTDFIPSDGIDPNDSEAADLLRLDDLWIEHVEAPERQFLLKALRETVNRSIANEYETSPVS